MMSTNQTMTPMTKEQWEKQESVMRRVYDEETGRLSVKSEGIILPEIMTIWKSMRLPYTVPPKAMDAYKLLGQIFENLNNKEKAVQFYKTSYELGEGQKDLVLKICELYTDVQCDPSVRLYWAEEGHRLFPQLYIDEIRANPTVVRLQTSLLQLY